MKRRGFVLIELPLVLALLVIVGLAIVAAIRFFSGEPPWYAWLLGGIAPPCLLIALGAVCNWLESRHERTTPMGQEKSELD